MSCSPPPLRSPATFLLLTLMSGCPKPNIVETVAEPEPEASIQAATMAIEVTSRRSVEGLRAVACDQDGCHWTVGAERTRFDPTTLEPLGTLPPLPEPAPEPTPAPAPAAEEPSNPLQAEMASWQALMASGGSLPFHRRVPVVRGMVTYQRGMGGGGGKLMRMGGGFRTIDAPAIAHTVTCEGWLAPHPSGLEVYLLLWPTPELTAYDSRALAPRWSIELPGPSQGLLVDNAGRFALLALTEPPDPDRLTDYPPSALADGAILPHDRPEHLQVVLLDLASGRVAAQAPGTLVAWLPSPDGGWLLATEREILRLDPR